MAGFFVGLFKINIFIIHYACVILPILAAYAGIDRLIVIFDNKIRFDNR